MFVSTDITGALSANMYAYCENNPVNRIDPDGTAWRHWAIGAVLVATCAIATVITCGGFAAAASTVWLVANGVAVSSSAATILAGAFIGTSIAYGTAVITALIESDSVNDFWAYGTWGTVMFTGFGAFVGGYNAYLMHRSHLEELHHFGQGSPKNNATPNGSYTKFDKDGNVYSFTVYDEYNRQIFRIDYEGRSHNGAIPHIHIFIYPEQGDRIEYVYDSNWNLL